LRGDVTLDLILLGTPCVAVRKGRILAVGPEEEVRARLGAGVRILDYGRSRVLPGLTDSHAHLVMTGLARLRLDLHGMSRDAVREAVKVRAEELPPGAWIQGAGFDLDELGLERTPSAADLDDVSPHHPVRLASHDLHALWVNSAALRAARRPESSPSYLTEDDVRLFNDAAGRAGPEERREATRRVQAEFHAFGITAVQEHLRLEEYETLAELGREDSLRIRVRFSVRDHQFAEFVRRRDEYPDVPGLLEANGQKIFLDGALGSRTARVLEPYLDTGGSGERARDPATARENVARAAAAGLPTFFHAIGDAAVREALDLAAPHPGLPHRVEHAQLVHPDDLPRFAVQGVTASIQPVHLLTDTPAILQRWGEERARRCFPVRSLLLSGAKVCFGSDSPVETPDPMRGVYAASRRRTLGGLDLPGEEAVPVETALSLYIEGPGLSPGAPADLTIWPADPARTEPEGLLELRPIATLFGGDLVYQA
jgi:predicted amidohydrolase YtcJ